MWDNDRDFAQHRTGYDDIELMKCCRTPSGYYIDYSSCNYKSTHDSHWEYYDSNFHHIVTCASGYVVTGMSKKFNPYSNFRQMEWIQCCRLGFGGGRTYALASGRSNDIRYVLHSHLIRDMTRCINPNLTRESCLMFGQMMHWCCLPHHARNVHGVGRGRAGLME